VEEIQLRIARSRSGDLPFDQWFGSLPDSITRARIQARLARIRLGNLGDSKNVGGGVHELRIDFGPGYRIYYARAGSSVVLLLGGGDKSTQRKDVARARQLWAEYKES
jgi:putative addiction module killer protein